jgi:hypothetical protein
MMLCCRAGLTFLNRLCAMTVDVARMAPVAVDMLAHRMASTVQPPRICTATRNVTA